MKVTAVQLDGEAWILKKDRRERVQPLHAFEIDKFPGYRFFVHRDDEWPSEFRVSELSTGAGVCRGGRTIAEAVERSVSIFGKTDHKVFQDAIARAEREAEPLLATPLMDPRHWIEEFYSIPLDYIPGFVADTFDMACHVRPVEGGIEVYFCKDDDEFEVSDKPYMRLYGDDRKTRYALLRYLFYTQLMVAVTKMIEEHPESGPKFAWILDGPLKLFYKPEYVDSLLYPQEVPA